MKTAFLGLGGMGYGMAANLKAAGSLAAVYNRTGAKAEAFAEEHDVSAVAEPAMAAEQAEVLVLCVSADADVLEMIDALAPALTADHIVIDCSTVASDTAREAARRVNDRGAAFVDAPVSGGTEGAKNATLSIMVGADETVFARVHDVLSAMGSGVTHMGPVGAGQATKAVNQIMVAGINQAVCEAMRFAAAVELPLDKVVDVVGAGAAGNWFVNHRGKTMVADVYEPGFKLKHHHKDLGICLHMAENNGGRLPLAAQTREEYDALMADGHGDEDISALYRRRADLFDR
ncbi:NAD(P)-dependent oxidoreductase [Salinisphaera sp. Q1T1-3]|uniref:NAD(P)-dependent oxidoreductase n=1 Tax=Salinisphaera sp. Q1T1-3 TaxID=2321229 RepID=UPI000E750BCC|nr:NAD(P)-dependent oxidoreductase [Salinisphaera sp. Q1T1-3]RJS91398.1 NAD(P)-dependent oxidoreductase [Salinisphaera sp. Q1T1-3]